MDLVSQTLAELQNPSLYKREDNIPIFGEHKRKKRVVGSDGKPAVDKEGNPVYQEIEVKEKDLPEICENSNNRMRRSGNLIKGTLGHFRYGRDVPETDQPPIACFYDNLRVGTFGPENEIAILATRYIRRDVYEKEGKPYTELVSREFPERSADYYERGKLITAVASLKRDADLDLGTISYARGGVVVRYISEETMPDEPMIADEPDKPPMTDPTKPPDADAPDEQYARHFHSMMKSHLGQHMKEQYPHLQTMHDHFAKHYAAAATPAAGPPMTSPGADMAPKPTEPAMPPPPKDTDMDVTKTPPVQSSRTETPSQYVKQTDLHALRLQMLRKEALAQVKELERQGVILDVQEEVAEVMAKVPAQYDKFDVLPDESIKYLKKIALRYDRDPTALPDLPIATNGEPDDPEAPVQSEAEGDRILQYIREESIRGRAVEYEDAKKAVRSKKKK